MRGSLYLFQRDSLVFGVVQFRALPAETVKLVEGGR